MVKKLVLFVLLCNIGICWAQNDESVDIVMATYPSDFETIQELVKRIDYDFKQPENKVRALYLWLAKHIEYDIYYQVTPPAAQWIVFTSQADKQQKKDALLKQRMALYFKERKALCRGYAGLFQMGCELMDIPVTAIHGYAKVSVHDIVKGAHYKNHSWNAVFINNRWNFIDLTWSAGYHEPNSGTWVARLNEYFYLTPPEIFIKSHFPVAPQWQLIQRPITEAQFFSEPIYYPAYFERKYALIDSQEGEVVITQDHIQLEFTSLPENTPLYYSFGGSNQILPVKEVIKNEQQHYVVYIPVPKQQQSQLTVYSEFIPVLDFKISAN